MERQRREAEEELNKLTFTPILETKALGGEGDGKGGKEGDKAEVKKVTGHVAELSNSYAERQMKARKEKSNNKSNNWRPTRAKRSPNANSSLLIGNPLSSSHHATLSSSSTMGGGNKSSLSPPPLNLQPLSMGESNSSSPFRQHLPLNEEDNGNVSPKDVLTLLSIFCLPMHV